MIGHGRFTGRKTPAIMGVCGACKRMFELVNGKVIEHQLTWKSEIEVEARSPATVSIRSCSGSNGRPDDVRARNRERARAKRRKLVDAVSGEASVVLDALLGKRADLDAEYDDKARERMLALAFVGYRIEFPTTPTSNGLLWCGNPKVRHDLYCRFCGEFVAHVPAGGWSTQTKEQRFEVTGRHVLICALQYLAGIRKLVAPGTRIDRTS